MNQRCPPIVQVDLAVDRLEDRKRSVQVAKLESAGYSQTYVPRNYPLDNRYRKLLLAVDHQPNQHQFE
jgi:hypothetical protein